MQVLNFVMAKVDPMVEAKGLSPSTKCLSSLPFPKQAKNVVPLFFGKVRFHVQFAQYLIIFC